MSTILCACLYVLKLCFIYPEHNCKFRCRYLIFFNRHLHYQILFLYFIYTFYLIILRHTLVHWIFYTIYLLLCICRCRYLSVCIKDVNWFQNYLFCKRSFVSIS